MSTGIYKQPSGGWKAIWRDPDGKQRSKNFDLKEDAEDHRREMLGTRKRGTYVDPGLSRQTLATFWTEKYAPWLESKSAATIAQYTRLYELYINPSERVRAKRQKAGKPDVLGLGRLSLAALTPGHIADWLVAVQRVTGNASALASFRVLRATLGRAVGYRYIAVNPAANVSSEDRPRVEKEDDDLAAFTPKELGQIINVMPERYKGLIMLLGLAGPRISEAAALRVRNVDLLHRKVRIERGLAEVEGKLVEGLPKSRKPRTIDIPPAVAEALKSHLGDPDAHVFAGPEGGPLRRSTFSARVWTPTLKRLGLEHRGVHSLRHSYASIAIENGVPLTAIQRQLGHATLEITVNTYSHLLRGTGEDAALKVEEAFREAAASTAQEGRKA